MTDTKSPAPIDNAKVEDTGEPVAWRYTWKHTALDWEYSDRALIPHSGMIVQPLYAAPTAPTTGSALWQVGDDTSSVQISRDGSTHKWGCKCEGCAPTTGSAPDAEAVAWRMPNAFSRHRHDKWHISQDLDDFPENGEWLYAASPAASVLTDDRIRELLGATATCTEDLNQPINLEWMRAFGIALLAASMGGDKL